MWTIRGHADDRLHPRQSPPLSIRRKRGEKKQAVGRSRGGRNTKIHALADAKGRLIAILLTGGEALAVATVLSRNFNCDIVVVDDENLWHPAWGTLV